VKYNISMGYMESDPNRLGSDRPLSRQETVKQLLSNKMSHNRMTGHSREGPYVS
jgi:hypothetical protein